MLDDPTWLPAPYALFTVDEAFSEVRCAELESLFGVEVPWARHEHPLYECFIADVTERLDARWLGELGRRMAELTGLELTDRAQVTVQRMEPGDFASVHSDRPLLGYEAVRLVLQLDRDWSVDEGGLFRAFDERTPILERHPRRNAATGLVLTEGSLHEVTPTRRVRRSVVFNFWHRGNGETVARLVNGLFGDMSFGALPDAVADIALVAEADRPESDTHRAATVATALTAWGYTPEEAATGYRLALSEPTEPVSELAVATAIARWLAHLHVAHFDLERWSALRLLLLLQSPGQYARIKEPWRLAFDGGQ